MKRIVRRATTLDERLRDRTPRSHDRDESERILAEWARAMGSREALARRLSWDGLDEATAAPLLIPPDDVAIGWADTLLEALDATDVDVPADIPFVHVWSRFLAVAQHRLGPPPAGLSLLRTQMERQLIDHLCRVAASATYRAFEEHRADGYEAFLHRMRGGGLLDFFDRYPVLARQLCRITDTFCETTRELCERLTDLGRPIAFRGGLSDRHDGGHQVAMITFESGATLVYKPGDPKLLVRYQELVEFLRSATSCESLPPTLEVIARGDHAWVECARPHATDDEAEARRYFRRAGGLVCIAWLLNGRDLHMENVIATAAGPVLVDAEALLQPSGKSDGAKTAMSVAHEKVAGSPLRSGLLTFPQTGADGSVYDIGGLSGRGDDRGSMETPAWNAINTDAMTMTLDIARTTPAENLLQFRGAPALPERFADDIVCGFEEVYSAVFAVRADFRRRAASLRSCRTRLVFRPTDVYGRLLQLLCSAPAQRDGAAASVLVEALNRNFGERPALWPLTAKERDAIHALDVPHFTIAADANVVTPQFAYSLSGVDVVMATVDAMSHEDREEQAAIIRSFLSSGGQAPSPVLDSRGRLSSISDAEALAAAHEIANTIASKAIRGSDGMTWLAPEYLRVGDRDDAGVAYSFYSGAAGIAQLFAALGLRDLAYGTLAPLRTVIRDPRLSTLASRERLGAGHGLGSMIYGLVAASKSLGDPALLDDALHLSAQLTPERIAGDRDFDVEGGVAGAALALAALFDATSDAGVHGAMMRCAQHLLDSSTSVGGGRAWIGGEGVPRAGFAHGAAGVASALLRAGFPEAAAEAFAFERSLYSEATHNWPVMVPEPIDMVAWCHGAPGIALGRLAHLRLADCEPCREEALIALETTAARGSSDVDHVCCGTFGRVDVLLTAASVLNEPKYAEAARRIARIGDFRLEESEGQPPAAVGALRPGYFRGLAGIGYTLLRIARPEVPPLIGFW